MSNSIIDVNNISMRFRWTANRIPGLKEYIIQGIRGNLIYEQFEALKHVSFSVNEGEVMGIVGNNGAGKSTLLKVISGILKPTEGTVAVRGKVVPMLELGSGFDYEMTGEENIFLNSAILGYSEAFIKQKYDDIVAFSELGDFVKIPLRSYSSGMIMRLAFSIATVVVPEVLIVDEILAVGDAAFQAKSKNRMFELMKGGTTVLFVSHSLLQIREMCDRVVWLEHGELKMCDKAALVCDAYQNQG